MSSFPENYQSSKSSKISQRWVTVCLGFLALFNALEVRVGLSVAITEMTYSSNSVLLNKSDVSYDGNNNQSNLKFEAVKKSNDVKYDWSEHTQGLILSSFYWGYIITNLLGGVIVRKFGSKYTLNFGILSTSLCNFLTPHCIYWGGSTGLIVLRVAMGVGEGTIYPAVIDLLAHWIPEDERAKAGSVVFSGTAIGTIFGIITSGVILQHSETGWPMIFYFNGVIGLVSFLLIAAFCYSRPSQNPYISDQELMYLDAKMGKINDAASLDNPQENLPAIPWCYILKSPAVWASFATKFSNNWGFVTIVSDMPKYMSSVLKYSVQENALMSSIPHLSAMIGGILSCWISDKAIAKRILSITNVRKIACTCATLGPAIFLVAASYVGSDGLLVVALQSIGLVFMGCAFCSILINAVDLSPTYASAIMGLGNGITISSGALSPYLVGVLTPNQTISEWRLVFWIVFGFYAASTLIYWIYGSGEVQEWNDPAFLNKKKISNVDQVERDVVPSTVN